MSFPSAVRSEKLGAVVPGFNRFVAYLLSKSCAKAVAKVATKSIADRIILFILSLFLLLFLFENKLDESDRV